MLRRTALEHRHNSICLGLTTEEALHLGRDDAIQELNAGRRPRSKLISPCPLTSMDQVFSFLSTFW